MSDSLKPDALGLNRKTAPLFAEPPNVVVPKTSPAASRMTPAFGVAPSLGPLWNG